jgi:hypothetical protein
MTAKSPKNTKTTAKKAKRLSLSKQTLKDLMPHGQGPKGGTLVRTGACAPTLGCGPGGVKTYVNCAGKTTQCYVGSF